MPFLGFDPLELLFSCFRSLALKNIKLFSLRTDDNIMFLLKYFLFFIPYDFIIYCGQLGCTHFLSHSLYTALAGLWIHTFYITRVVDCNSCDCSRLQIFFFSPFYPFPFQFLLLNAERTQNNMRAQRIHLLRVAQKSDC